MSWRHTNHRLWGIGAVAIVIYGHLFHASGKANTHLPSSMRESTFGTMKVCCWETWCAVLAKVN